MKLNSKQQAKSAKRDFEMMEESGERGGHTFVTAECDSDHDDEE